MTDWHPNEEEFEKCRARINDAYRDYVAHVSPSQMAISQETATYILWLCEKMGARTAIDFGSGFTSYVLRFAGCDTLSVDDSSEWLHWTGQFLDRWQVGDDNLVLLDDYQPQEVDVVVYDMANGQLRDDHFVTAFAAIAPGGCAVLDDANHPSHQKAMKRVAQQFRYRLYGLESFTTDWYRRFAALVIRP